jgi:hypothetical protein
MQGNSHRFGIAFFHKSSTALLRWGNLIDRPFGIDPAPCIKGEMCNKGRRVVSVGRETGPLGRIEVKWFCREHKEITQQFSPNLVGYWPVGFAGHIARWDKFIAPLN